MPIYCDESGGTGAGVVLMASLSMSDDAAHAAMSRVRQVLGLRGELKGSRISMAERAFVVELLCAAGVEAYIVESYFTDNADRNDIARYAAVLEQVTDHWALRSGGCVTLVVDDGRYDARINAALRADVQSALGQWGKVALADSRRSAGVQFADVLANSHFHVAIGSSNAKRVEALLDPFWRSGQIRRVTLSGDAPARNQPS